MSGGGPWFVAAKGSLFRLGAGDLSMADLIELQGLLDGRALVALPVARSLQEYLPKADRWGIGRLQRYERLRDRRPPSVGALARGAQVAVLPGEGIVWVDAQRIFRPGEVAPLPWTDPPVELTAVRPGQVLRALRAVIGTAGPKRVAPAHEL